MPEKQLPLVVLHGWGHDKSSWANFIQRFQGREVIALDLPGFGAEPLVSSDWGVPEYAEWTEKKIESLNLGPMYLLGHSFGGRIAALVASNQPEWLRGLILYGAPVLYRPSASIQAKIGVAKFLKSIAPKSLIRNRELAKADSHGLGKIFRRVVPYDETSTLPLITASTLLLWGENDTEVPLSIAEEAKGLIPASMLTILPGAGHNAHLEYPDLFYGLVTRYLAHAEDTASV